ncbi:lysine--tRNA ligase [Neoehrlichia mikurensis]|uniref:Lysine--tRNA ligase n=1 Tax=Neoehrlichia mikurensis TaxID=89586 RepID=A0A9Q9BYC6_9RICK|nr:lysine--tRNA ligase [Neoehrlichia mikurensis]QXK91914.1 lysine--tRNA ligase [Neoehrlichia mikurensis]QXK93127.1 lysine--tRNA ligase [Neoehrlichia mikurensis]QXK93607.1 lysine--tRNA ligase [Neoehrlichia mikurensis]UTO55438.1 lysine--tRNA ligase [Neoehrlichia mikurensis]UTO56358.1 lysine--tRNA ligase [Neoehrlichia mikurensis]
MQYNSWPFQEAEKILQKFDNKKEIVFETGYGPSGLPHIGTFSEVLRTTFIMNALREISPNINTKLIVVSDDMDGLRKIPDNIVNKEILVEHLGKPLTVVPDPFGLHESYGHYMNALLRKFLDFFNFEYDFRSATEFYKSGFYDEKLLLLLKCYDQVMDVMLPTLGEIRQKTYSPFLPICPKTSKVLQVPVVKIDTELGSIFYKDPEDGIIEIPVTGGNCKLQWKPDWGMRWAAFNVNYETHGKDLTPSAELSSEICKILGSNPPILFCYELFLDKDGKKISKSKGNGISIEDWLLYAPSESLALYLFQHPKRAKRLYFDVIPKSVDNYLELAREYNQIQNYDNPVWHIHNGKIPSLDMYELNFSLLLNLASACNAENSDILWGFIKNYNNDIDPGKSEFLNKLVVYAVRYYHNFIKPNKVYRIPTNDEKEMLNDLVSVLLLLQDDESSSNIQNQIFVLGKKYYTSDLKQWFTMLYEVLLGQSQGPKLGSFIKLYGIKNTITLIKKLLDNRSSNN